MHTRRQSEGAYCSTVIQPRGSIWLEEAASHGTLPHSAHAANNPRQTVGGTNPMEQRIDVFCHILPKRYEEERWKRADKTHFVEHSPSHLKFVRGGKAPITNYEILIDLDA